MLIYNYKKEFVGIDEADLKVLGFSSIADMRAEAADFADLFVKTPGYIHNFKHVHWIDYIACNDSGTDSKAIINVKGKNYAATIGVRTIYLVDNPAQKAFIVELLNLKPLSQTQEAQIISMSAAQKQEKKITPQNVTPLKEEPSYHSLSPNVVKDQYEDESHHFHYEAPSKPRDINIEMHDLLAETPAPPKAETHIQESIKKPLSETKQPREKEEAGSPFANYVYDPHVASHDLGLPIDLVEEFIQDFIAQANSFKNDLYNSLGDGHMDNLRIQSHKLKGVAANLRIEDALDALTIINSSHDEHEIKTNLDRFYKIINKLAKNEAAEVAPAQAAVETKEADEDLVLSFKNEPPALKKVEISDADVPDSIELPELADDDFLKHPNALVIKQEDEESENLLTLEEPLKGADAEAEHEKPKVVLHYDKKRIAHEIGLDIESFNELFEDYLTEAKEISVLMNTSMQKNDLAGCRSAAFKLKGMSENMRVHDFDTALEGIVNAKEMAQIKGLVADVTSILSLISKTEGK